MPSKGMCRPISVHSGAWAIAIAALALGACSERAAPAAQAAAADYQTVLAEAGQTQDIEITWVGGPYKYEYEWGGGTADDPTPEQVELIAAAIAQELRVYPKGFLRSAAINEIVLVQNLHVAEEGDSRGAAGYIFEGRFFIDLPYAVQAIQAGTRVRFIHHVLWHQLDERAGTLWDDPEWTALNPDDFEYGVYSKGGVHEKRLGTGRLSTDIPGFLNLYSTGNVPDDKAEVFAYLVVLHSWMEQHANVDTYLRRKIDLVKLRLEALNPAFSETFWESIDASSDSAEKYM